MPYNHVCKLDFDGLAELLARICGVDIVVISERTISGSSISLLGKYGSIANMPRNYALPVLDPDENNLVVFKDVPNDPRFKDHTLRTVYPVLNTMLAASLYRLDCEKFISVGIPNVPLSFLQNNEAFCSFVRVLEFVRLHIRANFARPIVIENQVETDSQTVALAEVVDTQKETEAAMQFLRETLRKKQSLHEGKSSSYFSLRSWRNAKKPMERNALETLRLFPNVQAADLIASEICEMAMFNHGTKSIEYVVPIPPEKGEVHGSLCEMVARAVAEKLSSKTQSALLLSGGVSSTAGKSRTPSMKMAQPLSGSVLLVTDAAVSHRRMDTAQLAIRKHDISSFAISWIGP